MNSYKILVVDDNITNIKVAQGILTMYKVRVDTALSGKECLEKIILIFSCKKQILMIILTFFKQKRMNLSQKPQFHLKSR